MRTADVLTAITLIIGGLLVFFWVIPHQVGASATWGLSAAMFPKVATGGCIFFAAILLIQRLTPLNQEFREENPMPLFRWGFLLVAALLFAIAVITFQFWSFLIVAPILVGAFMVFAGCRKPLLIVLVSLSVAFITYALFWELLGIPLP